MSRGKQVHLKKKTKAVQQSDKRKARFEQKPENASLLVTAELNKALEECKAKVDHIAKECRAKNRRFRDIEFDLENDSLLCLQGLNRTGCDPEDIFSPADVQRVTQIFDNPQFFVDGADSNDIVQGSLGDCWFLSALATMSTAPGLIEKFCVARDEEVGVYGFIFFRDAAWVTVIIDDLLCTAIPKFEELTGSEKALYHNDKEHFNMTARKGGKSLYFARSGTHGETWVPLIEKAYAKLHGDYQSLSGGFSAEAIEDLTGGVSSFVHSKDILDPERFWKEELLNVTKDRLFGCAFNNLDPSRSGQTNITINGLVGGHAYSILRAVEYKDKKFIVIRNPWGQSEWTGAWSDGSKEWNAEWISALSALGHVFGEDGQFVMEYKDFLGNFEHIDRTRLFDSTWIMSSIWLEVPVRDLPSAWSYGDVCFTISLEKPSSTVIVLSLLDDRYYRDINGRSRWSFDFLLFKKGESSPLAGSSSPRALARSGNLEIDLEAGDYVVHVRLDRSYCRVEDYFEVASKEWDERKLSRVLAERAKSQSIVSNFKKDLQSNNLPIPLEELSGRDLEAKREAELAASKAAQKDTDDEKTVTVSTEDDTGENVKPQETPGPPRVTVTKTIISKKTIIVTTTDGDSQTITQKQPTILSVDVKPEETQTKPEPDETLAIKDDVNDKTHEDVKDDDEEDDDHDDDGDNDCEADLAKLDELGATTAEPEHEPVTDTWISDSVFLGLRVYTRKNAVAVIGGQLSADPTLKVVIGNKDE